METKMFEIRDRGTLIPVVATKLSVDKRWERNQEREEMEAEAFLLGVSGYNDDKAYILVSKIEGGKCESQYSAFDWDKDTRTMFVAHEFIEKNFDSLSSGEVVDVEYLLKETDKPKLTDRL